MNVVSTLDLGTVFTSARVANASLSCLAGGTKKQQQNDIDGAKANWKDYKRRKKLKEEQMPLTKDFRETIRERARKEPAFRRALLQEAIELMLTGDVTTGKALIRNYINATVGFQDLARAVHTSAPSLMRMFGPKGNPSAKNLFGIIAHLQKQEGVNFALRSVRPS